MEKTKQFIYRFRKWIIGFIIGGTALAAGTTLLPPKDPVLATSIDGQQTRIEYTDENIGEGLIIRTDNQDYLNVAGNIGVYFSVYNGTKDDQNVKIVFSFAKDYQPKVWEYDGEATTTIIHSATATTSEYTTYDVKTRWKELFLEDFTTKTISRKDTNGTQSLKENTAFIKSGETKFFKADIKYLTKDREEFFIEAFGDTTYGHLDPWTYEQLFNTLNDGDLAGQDSWSNAATAIISVQTTTKYEGAKGLSWADNTNNPYYLRTITAISDNGVMYIAMQRAINNAGELAFSLRNSATGNRVGIAMRATGWVALQGNNWITYSANTWYVFRITFSVTNGNYTVASNTGAGWSAESNTITMGASGNIDRIALAGDADAGGSLNYFDTITPTDPTITALIPDVNIILFEE